LGARDRDGCHCVRFQRVFEVFKSGCASHHRPSPFPVLDLLLQASIRIATIGAEVCLTNPHSVFFSPTLKKKAHTSYTLLSWRSIAMQVVRGHLAYPSWFFLLVGRPASYLDICVHICMEGNGGDRPYAFVVFMSLVFVSGYTPSFICARSTIKS
jgi:hypothetical protein